MPAETHPTHFHLVNVQVINRQMANISSYPYVPIGPVIPPDPSEKGWKETVHMYPGTVTRVIMKFDLSKTQIVKADGCIIATPASPRTGGAEYVWHCHILEHEEHDMDACTCGQVGGSGRSGPGSRPRFHEHHKRGAVPEA